MNDFKKNTSGILPAWQNFFRRLQSTTRNHDGGIAVVQMILVMKDGKPLFWPEPKIIKLEPKLTIDMETLQKEISNEDFIELLNLMVNKS